MSTRLRRRSASSEALRRLISEGGDQARAVRRAVDRSLLWRLQRGIGGPSLELALRLDEMTDGRVPAAGWLCLLEEERGEQGSGVHRLPVG